MNEYRPKPWSIKLNEYDPDEVDILDSTLCMVARVYGAPEAEYAGPERDQLNADARLIAASPRMYALLCDAVHWGLAREQAPNWHLQAEVLLNDIEKP